MLKKTAFVVRPKFIFDFEPIFVNKAKNKSNCGLVQNYTEKNLKKLTSFSFFHTTV